MIGLSCRAGLFVLCIGLTSASLFGGKDGNEYVRKMSQKTGKRHPIVLVPGLGGSQLWAKLNRPTHPHFYCFKKTQDFYSIWLSLTQLVPPVVNCYLENFRLYYNRSSGTTYNPKGVDIEALNFGHPKSVEWLDPFLDKMNSYVKSQLPWAVGEGSTGKAILGDSSGKVNWLEPGGEPLQGLEREVVHNFKDLLEPAVRFASLTDLSYFSSMVERLVAEGYRRDVDIRAAPYDFRKAPNEMLQYFQKTKRLIEETYSKNDNTPVVIVAHSMGNPVMLHFYNHVVSSQWKAKYIKSHVSLAAPWTGAVKSLKLMVSGDSLGLKYLKSTKIRILQRSMVSSAWLLPSPHWWRSDRVLVSTPRRNYTVRDYDRLFADLKFGDGYRMWKNTNNINSELKWPGVELHCLYGTEVKTPGQLVYTTQSAFPDSQPRVIIDDGDGTVNRASLEAFIDPWVEKRKGVQGGGPGVKSLPLKGVTHVKMLKDKRVLQYVVDVARGA